MILAPKSNGPGTREELLDYAYEYLVRPKREILPFIFDRFVVPSEYIYGPAIRGFVNLTAQDCQDMEVRLHLRNPLLIYCERPVDKIMETFDEREQMEGVEHNLEKILTLYELVLDKLNFTWFIRYNYEDPKGYEEVVSIVKDYLNMEGSK